MSDDEKTVDTGFRQMIERLASKRGYSCIITSDDECIRVEFRRPVWTQAEIDALSEPSDLDEFFARGPRA